MNKKDKELLIKDLCARLPYEVRCFIEDDYDANRNGTLYEMDLDEKTCGFKDTGVGQGYWYTNIFSVKPYLRPMSSMTKEEFSDVKRLFGFEITTSLGKTYIDDWKQGLNEINYTIDLIDWLNANHFDYRGLIGKGLAIEAPEGIYNLK